MAKTEPPLIDLCDLRADRFERPDILKRLSAASQEQAAPPPKR
jgi:hypothetical protein